MTNENFIRCNFDMVLKFVVPWTPLSKITAYASIDDNFLIKILFISNFCCTFVADLNK